MCSMHSPCIFACALLLITPPHCTAKSNGTSSPLSNVNDTRHWRSLEAALGVVQSSIHHDCVAHFRHKSKNHLNVAAPSLGLNTTNSSEIAERLHMKSMLVCQQLIFADDNSTNRVGRLASTAGATAVVLYSDTLGYLTDKSVLKVSTQSRLSATRSKFKYAAMKDSPLFIVLGRLDQLQVHHQSPTCPQGLKTRHNSLKALGMLAVFTFHPDLYAQIYIDADAAIIDYAPAVADYLALSLTRQVDVVATSNWEGPILANGGVLIFRNTLRGRTALAAWWAYRCLTHDQPGLWRAISEMWPGWEQTKQEEFWADKTPGVLNYVMRNHELLRQRGGIETRFPCEGACGWLFLKTGCLLEPVELPGTLLISPMPFDPMGNESNGTVRKMDALQHYTGLLYHDEVGQFICHTDHLGAKTCAPHTTSKWKDKTGEELEQIKQKERTSQLCRRCVSFVNFLLSRHRCEHDRNNTIINACECHGALAPEYTLMQNESKVIAMCPTCLDKKLRRFEIPL
uniref:Nucleotide-diphospho-sugar transferase domain-containing protein n=1 Tax=Chrysotila carterae TaxID=13221 RepID=A0A7S4F2Q7_CHRCT|mmetsp:Transcript_9434/g.20656  ORF Transcript_9434/g.20656 Transcript_9434/m.20656 type:complete len:512 (-) Transcript_9434:329-1864(-)